MGKLIGKLSPTATAGEQRFQRFFEKAFGEDDRIYFYAEPVIGERRPDFLALSPYFGVLVVEIKDYNHENLRCVKPAGSWEYVENWGNMKEIQVQNYSNPFDQLYESWKILQNRVQRTQFSPSLKIPVIQLAILTNVPENSEIGQKILQIAPKKINLCFQENFTLSKNFKKFFKSLLKPSISLKPNEFKALRGNIIRTARLPETKQKTFKEFFTPEQRIRLLDQEQERVARSLGSGHRIIFGVAGSGKTIIAVARAKYLAQLHPEWRILVLCYNRLLAEHLYQVINPQDFDASIEVTTFHKWLQCYLDNLGNNFTIIYNHNLRTAKNNGAFNQFCEQVAPKILLMYLEEEQLKNGENSTLVQYDAIIIDEGQDFHESWYKCVMGVLDPEKNSLLVTLDGLQGIFKRKNFRWSDVGISARGRTKRFAKSYRVPKAIAEIARFILPNKLKNRIGTEEGFIDTEEFAGIKGKVEFIVENSPENEYKALTKRVSEILTANKGVMVLFQRNMQKANYSSPFFDLLREMEITWEYLDVKNYTSDCIRIGTLHATKGLEFDTLIIPELNLYNSYESRQLLYVGMTRAKHHLILSAHRPTKLISALLEFVKDTAPLT